MEDCVVKAPSDGVRQLTGASCPFWTAPCASSVRKRGCWLVLEDGGWVEEGWGEWEGFEPYLQKRESKCKVLSPRYKKGFPSVLAQNEVPFQQM